jgi:hypothetical protein
MSLQIAAQHLASRGRGPDTTLVHMAPQEVAGLQALAKAHGGTLTVNPDTGLAEAGFLSSILPMVAGAALAATGVGAPMAAMMVGGGMTVATGSLQKGLMAGLGAYGGAGLAGGLMGAGAAGAGAAGTGLSALDAGMGLMPTGTIGAAEAVGASALDAGMGAMPTGNIGASALDAGMGAYPNANLAAAPIAPPVNPTQPLPAAVQTVTKVPPTFSDNVSQMFQGAKNLGTEAGREAFMGNAASKGVEATGVGGTKGLMQYGLAGFAPVLAESMKPKQVTPPPEAKARNYDFSYNPVANPEEGYTGAYTGQRTYLNPTFTERRAASGGLMDIGPIEAMSNRNQAETLMANGGQMFAEGGETKAVKPVAQDPYYTMSGQSGDAFKYLMGQMPAPSKAPAPAAPTGMSGFLGGITGIASPEGIQKTDGTFVPWSASNPMPTGSGLFGKAMSSLSPAGQSEFKNQVAGNRGLQLFMGGSQPQDQGAGGYWEEDTSGLIKPYTFDPNTGTFTAAPVPKRFVPYAAPATTTNVPWDGGGTAANGGLMSLAQGGVSHLGDYSDGGRLLKGPGDGVSDDIPATIGDKRPARLADGEFVVPARIVSELGNGSTEAGARKLYAMMDRVQKARKKSIGKDRVAVNSRAEKLLPA